MSIIKVWDEDGDENLWIEPFPTKPIDGKIVRVDRTMVGVDKKGKLYSTQVDRGVSYSIRSNMESTFKGLVKLKVLKAADVRAHEAYRKEINDRRDREYASEYILKNAKEAGIKLTPVQEAILKKNIEEDPSQFK